MDYAKEERIGNPDLFTGRKEELAYFLKWIDNIKERKSQSTAMLARRKMGKTSIMERLFNITFYKNGGVIPFYYEIKENDVWIVDFCVDFFLTFICHYIAYITRKTEYLNPYKKNNLERARQDAKKEGLDFLGELIESVEHLASHEHVDLLWETVRTTPQTIASRRKEFILQMVDEFQFMNAMIYWDKAKKNLARNLAGGYLSTAESKVAPLLVSGSWVGWLMDELKMMLPARFRYKSLKNMPENEAIEMLFKYSRFFDVPVTEETAYLIARLSQGSPFYISSIIRSDYEDKDLTTIGGLTAALEFETLDDHGSIKSTWMEYVKKAFRKVNDRHIKNIVLHLCKHRDQEVTRRELQEKLNLEMSDADLEKKMDALVKADIVEQGASTTGNKILDVRNAGTIEGAVFNRDGTRILTWREDGNVSQWDAATGDAFGKVMKLENQVNGAIFNKDETRIRTWSFNGNVQVWDIAIDPDFPMEHIKLQAEAISGTSYDIKTNAIKTFPPKDWREKKEKYMKIAGQHYKSCGYPEGNVFRRLFPKEAQKIRPYPPEPDKPDRDN